MIARIPKEVCRPCHKFINIGQPILECDNCSLAIHIKCFKNCGFTNCNNLWVCSECAKTVTPRYNPFSYIEDQDTDKFYNDNDEGAESTLRCISLILETCKSYTNHEFQQLLKSLKIEETPLISSFFLYRLFFQSN